MTVAPNRQVSQETEARGLTLRVVLLAVALVVLGDLWIRLACLLTFVANIDNSVPPAPAILGLLTVLLINTIARKVSDRLCLSRAEITCLYIMLLTAIPMASLGIVRPFLPSITALHYFAAPENHFAELATHVPAWLAPRDPELIRNYYEASLTEQVPWGQWAIPLLAWSGFFMAFFFVLMCISSLLMPQWVTRDKLAFPLATFNAELIGVEAPRETRHVAFFRSPLMWIGFTLAFIYNAFNVAQSLNPGIRALGLSYDLGGLFTESPWDAVRPFVFYHRLEHIGFGYLIPLEILASTWGFYIVLKGLDVFGRIIGYTPPGYPYLSRQSYGGYIGMALTLLYMARGHIANVISAVAVRSRDDTGPLAPPVAVFGLILGVAALIAFCWAAGMSPWLAAAFFLSMLLVAITFSRIRGETGTPSNWAFPFGESKSVLLAFTGTASFVRGGGVPSLTILSVMNFLSRGYFPSLMAYQMENFELARRANLRRNDAVVAMLAAVIIGLAVGYYIHLDAFYKFGANVVEGGTTSGGYRTTLAVQEFQSLDGAISSPSGPQTEANIFTIAGALLTIALAALRFRFLRFPLHPLGFCLATSYGYLLWGPFLVVYIIKWTIVKIGGAPLYRRLVPLFLGIAFGHFFTAGIVWGVIGAYLPIDPSHLLHIDVG